MKRSPWIDSFVAALAVAGVLSAPLWAAGPRGGAGRPGGGGGARPGGGAGMSRPAPRPNVSVPHPAPRPNITRPSPSISRPSPSINRPAPNVARPSTPNISRPSGGLKPSTPTVNRPDVTRPNIGGGNIGPGTLPGNIAGNRPTTRPGTSLPSIGNGGVATTRPGLPTTRPGGGITTPGGITRPGGAARPTPGDVGDFLGMQKPLRPDVGGGRPTTLPGTLPGNRPDIGRPGTPGTRPGITRPENRPGTRPEQGFRPGSNIGSNTIINSRPGWANIGNDKMININNNWNNAIATRPNRPGLGNWGDRHPDRIHHWHNWGNNIHDRWHNHWHDWHGCFGGDWWSIHHHSFCGWHYGCAFGRYPYAYWWRPATWVGLGTWFAYGANIQPIYYDYGTGGNVVYQDNSVYINGEQVATTEEFAQSAATLATVPPPANDTEAAKAEWMPLGTFAVSTSEKDVEPTRMIQLAVNKDGVISGTLYNKQTDKSQTVQGKVDKATQRVAFRIGESENVVVETGLYNLTQDEAPALVHFGADKVETYLLVRLEQPADTAAP